MDILIAFVLTICPEPIKIPETGWNNNDLLQLEIAKEGCKKFFGPRSCLIEFRKIEDRDYEAICENR